MITISKKMITENCRFVQTEDGYYTNGYWGIKMECAKLRKGVCEPTKGTIRMSSVIDASKATDVLTFSKKLSPGCLQYTSDTQTCVLDAVKCKQLKAPLQVRSVPNSNGEAPVMFDGVILATIVGVIQ